MDTLGSMEIHSESLVNRLSGLANEARKLIVEMAATPTGCHIGGSLSVIDLLLGVYSKYGEDPNHLIVLSKGHSAAALYACLYLHGVIEENPAVNYGQDGSLLTGHPNHKLPGDPLCYGKFGSWDSLCCRVGSGPENEE